MQWRIGRTQERGLEQTGSGCRWGKAASGADDQPLKREARGAVWYQFYWHSSGVERKMTKGTTSILWRLLIGNITEWKAIGRNDWLLGQDKTRQKT